MAQVFRKLSKRRLSLTLTRNKVIEQSCDSKSEQGGVYLNADSGDIVDNREFDSDDDFVGKFSTSGFATTVY